MSDKHAELTEKQKLFCEYYIEHWNATDAAKRAGYSEKTAQSIGAENLTKPLIKKYIEEIQKDIAKLAGISRLSIVKDLLNIKDNAEQEKDQIKAIEVVNKMLGMNEPDKTENKTTIVSNTKDMTTQELLQRAEATKTIESLN